MNVYRTEVVRMSWVTDSMDAQEARAGRTFICHAEAIAWGRGEAQALRGEPCDDSASTFHGFGAAHREGYAHGLSEQACRDCGVPFPYDVDADRCSSCVAATLGERVQS